MVECGCGKGTQTTGVYAVSAWWKGDSRRQICHRILKFAFYKCIQKVTILPLCSNHPHLNLITTALHRIWDVRSCSNRSKCLVFVYFCGFFLISIEKKTFSIMETRSDQSEDYVFVNLILFNLFCSLPVIFYLNLERPLRFVLLCCMFVLWDPTFLSTIMFVTGFFHLRWNFQCLLK